MEVTSDLPLDDSSEDLFLTQNSFNPPADLDGIVSTQKAVDAVDYLLTFDKTEEEDWRKHESVQYFDFTYQVNNSSTVCSMPIDPSPSNVNDITEITGVVTGDQKEENIIPLISDLHLDEFFSEVIVLLSCL